MIEKVVDENRTKQEIQEIKSDSYLLSEKNNSINENSKAEMKIITEEFKQEIEKMVDQQFEKEYIKLNNEYEEKIEELLNEQEEIFNRHEILKAKYNSLEKYLKNYCKKAGIDYDSLLLDDDK